MRIQCGGTVRANDAEIFESVVSAVPVDVIEDQRDAGPPPELVLTAELAERFLEALVVKAVL
jgi:hypothetical protein